MMLTTKCSQCGMQLELSSEETDKQEIACPECGSVNDLKNENLEQAIPSLDTLYRSEFRRIHRTSEEYQGAWNTWANVGGVFWALAHGIWLSPLVFGVTIIILLLVMRPLGVLILLGYHANLGGRGTWLYYNSVVKKKQLIM